MFRFTLIVQMLVLAALIFAARHWIIKKPDRWELGPRVSEVRFRPVNFRGADFGSLEFAGAWVAEAADPRFGAFSGLALDRGGLLAVTDAGSLAWFDKPEGRSGRLLMADLPAGPGNPRFKRNRDAEALLADLSGRGWWVSFERANELWLYDRAFSRPLLRIRLNGENWPVNEGVEGLAPDRKAMLLFMEGGKSGHRLDGAHIRGFRVIGAKWRLSEATRLPDGRLFAIERTLGWSGFRTALLHLEPAGRDYRVRSRIVLPLGAFDNMEGMTAERMPDGRTRLWIIADDNFERPIRTLLIALDLPPEGGERR